MECVFDYVERFALLLNDLDGSMKLPPGKISPGKLPQNFLSHENPNYEHYPIRKPPYGEASGIVILQKSSRVHQTYIP